MNEQDLEEMSNAVAPAVITYAFDTRSVNGNGKGRPVAPPPAGGAGAGTGTGASTGYEHLDAI